MPILDFSEIPEAHIATGEQDTFELFGREFLEYIGFTTSQGPDRGPDGGRDLIVRELRKGVGGETIINWLVSCKHKAHSGSSVGINDEIDIPGRVAANSCQGFIGFYSTLPSSGLTAQLEGLKDRLEYQIYDREKIEQNLLNSSKGISLSKRYFSESTKKWLSNKPKPEKFYWEFPRLACDYCGKDLLEPKRSGIVVMWEKIYDHRENYDIHEYVDIYCSCKGHCDRVLKANHYSKYEHVIDAWEDIPDIAIPTVYFKWVNSIFIELYHKAKYSESAFKKIREIMLAIFPYISRELTEKEKDTVKSLTGIPSFLGGLG
jgi:hypothetical protein